ncbi:MAG: efflux RND transporter permease subunit, partial [Gemmatimonadota bacterium]|nr:efflux RND transporter permease subunit [Gemmatimonadota bacterium]
MVVKETGVYKEFKLASFAIDHPTSVLVLTAIVILMGVVSYVRVPKESFPEIVLPTIVVNTIYAGVAPKDVETLVTRPIEEELNTISDVETIRSVSVEGYSSITVEFGAGIDITEALQQTREKIDLAKAELPSAAEEPNMFEINLSEFPIMQVNIAGPYGLVRLREIAEDLQDDFEQVPSILEARLAGGLEREVQVDVDLSKLKYYGVSFNDVIDAIRAENVTVPGGTIEVGDVNYLVRIPGEFETTALIGDIVVKATEGLPIYVKDVADVDFGFKDQEVYARLDGESVVSLSIIKRGGDNLIETADRVREIIAEAEADFPPGTNVKITMDQSKDIKSMVSNLENSIISGLLLVVAVLLFFLGFRTAAFVGMAIPVSMLLSFIIIRFAGFSMNMVVLFSLILALGMLVDNAIVVVENIYRFREHGFDKIEAAKIATGEVALPIIASTATTLAAFLPLTFWPGMMGEFMKYLPLTLIITLSSSLFVGLIIIPTVCSLFLETEDVPIEGPKNALRYTLIGGMVLMAIVGAAVHFVATAMFTITILVLYAGYHYLIHPVGHWFMNHGIHAVLERYERVLKWALHYRFLTVAGTVMAFVLAFVAFIFLNAGMEFFPEDIPPASVYVQVEAPLGTRLDHTDGIVRRIEERLAEVPGRADFSAVLATVGSRISGDPSGGGSGGSNVATISVNFIDFEDREYDAFETLEYMRSTLGQDIAGADISVEKPQEGPPTGLPVSIEIAGEDPDVLKRLGDRVVSILENDPVFAKLDGLESDLADGRPELLVDVDRERAALWGLNTSDVGFTVRNAINGAEASTFRDGNEEYDITVRLAEEYREDLNAIGDLTVMAEGGRQVPISSVASWETALGYGDVNRKDLDRVVTISSEVRAGNQANRVLEEVKQVLLPFQDELPAGYRLVYAGQQTDQAESEAFLLGAFTMAIVLIAFILISQFDSVFKPFIILTSVLLSTMGVLIGLMVFRMPFGIIMTGVGVISLAGVVVNNAIVLIDYIGILVHRDGMSVDRALLRAGLT